MSSSQMEEHVEKGMSFLASIAHQVQKNAPVSKPRSDSLGPLTMKELVLGGPRWERRLRRTYSWQGDDLLLRLSYMTLTLITPEWHAQLWVDQVTGKFAVRIVGDPDVARKGLEGLVGHDVWRSISPAVMEECEKRKDPYQRIPIPGKKKSEKKGPASNTGADVSAEGPVFGKPETGKRRRKK